jgi:hypothetical protein
MAKKIKDNEPKIRKYYTPTKEEEEILQNTYDRYYRMKDSPDRKKAEEEWEAGEAAWEQYESAIDDLEEWQANYYVPVTTGVIESILSEMMDNSPRPLILPRSTEDKPRATVMRNTFEYTWETANGDEELESVMKDALIYGDGFAQEYYWKDRRIVRKLSNINEDKKGKKKEEYEEIEVFDYDDCYMESISPWELYFDDKARSINRGPYKARDAVRRYVMDINEARRFFSGDVWDPLNNMRYVRPGSDTNWYQFYKPPEGMDKKDDVEVLWYWSRAPQDALNIVINDVVVKHGPNPYKHKQLPFAKTEDVKRPHKFYHKGEPKLLESIQRETNTMRRMITDRNHLDIDKMWLVGRGESYAEEDTISRPHGIMRVDDPANYKPIEYGDIPQSVGVTLGELNKDAVRVTGVEDRFQSVSKATTATEAAIQQEAVQRRIKAKLRRLEQGFLIDIGRMRVANIIQFYSQPRLEEIIGEAGSQQYHKQLMDLQRKGMLQMIDKKPFKEEFREIRLEDKELITDERGIVQERPIKGFSFFDLKPDYFVPVARGGYDIRFEAGSTMPVSESLLAKQAQDVATILMPLATAGIGYDPVKLGDWILETLKKNPSELHMESEEQDISQARNEMQINLATQENQEVTQGKPIPQAGTPYATPGHTMVHIAYMRSPQAKAMKEEDFRRLTKHAMGEVMAQTMRGDVASLTGEQNPGTQSQNQGDQPSSGNGPPVNEELQAIQPGVVQGGEQVQGGQKGSMMNRVFSLMGRKR